jgi:hypothetical protein
MKRNLFCIRVVVQLSCETFHFQNLRRLFRAAEVELRLVAELFAHEQIIDSRKRCADTSEKKVNYAIA